ncbi:MAG: peptide deformylase [Sphaerochaetaceae bacterium]|nr:peptide deformylase [Sphaerochaetaceae bacterium]
MIKKIIRDEKFLSIPSTDCTQEDLYLYDDLMDTLKANSEDCVGLAANMIGVSKNAIIFLEQDGSYTVMFNPQILSTGANSYLASEGCLSLVGKRKTMRFMEIDVMFLNKNFRQKVRHLDGLQAKIVQHEIDHTKGILI